MKIFKIIVGVLLIYGAGQEYVHSSKQLFTFLDPGIISAVVLMLILCAWLVGSGFSKDRFPLKSWQFLKYFGLSCLLFLAFAFVSMATFKFPPDIVNVNGINVNIAEFMNGTKRIVPDEHKRREYCICVVTKLTADKALVDAYQSEFESGQFSNVLTTVQHSADADRYGLQECAAYVSGE